MHVFIGLPIREITFLRKAENIIRRDELRNNDIRQIIGTTPCLQDKEKQRIKWFWSFNKNGAHPPAKEL